MASVPNMHTAAPPAVPGAAPLAEGEGGDLFASLLSAAPAGQAILHGPAATDGEAVAAIDARVRPVPLDAAIAAEADEDAEGEAGAGDAQLAADDAEPAMPGFTPATDFIPILQAQSSYPVAATVIAARVPDGATSVTAPMPQAPAMPAGAAGADAPDPAPRPAPPSAAVPEEGDAPSEAPAPDLPIAVKAALKAATRGKTAAAEEAPAAARVRPQAEAPLDDAPAAARPAAKDNPPAAAPTAPSPAVQSAAPQPAAPDAVAPIAGAMPAEPALQTAQPERAAAPQPQAMDQAIERELDLAHESEWLDRLARDIVRSGASDGPLRFKLHPQTLGHLRVELTQGDQGMTVRLTAETEAARAIIADAQPRLMQEARAQGVRIAHAEVDLAGNGHQASGDPRRQEDGRRTVFIRTARGAGIDAAEAAGPGRVRSDRYA